MSTQNEFYGCFFYRPLAGWLCIDLQLSCTGTDRSVNIARGLVYPPLRIQGVMVMRLFMDYLGNGSRCRIFGAFCLFLVGYLWGGVTVHKELFPFEQIRQIKNILARQDLSSESTLSTHRNSLFETFQAQSDVVMIGDSITQFAQWAEIFPGVSIVNRGIGGDRSSDILSRISTILAVKPKKAFLMLGINDLVSGVGVDEVYKNYVEIVKALREEGVKVYIQSTVECSRKRCGKTLEMVRDLNERLAGYSEKNGISYIDINDGIVSEQEGLVSTYTYDGIHLLGPAYLKWRDKISNFVFQG